MTVSIIKTTVTLQRDTTWACQQADRKLPTSDQLMWRFTHGGRSALLPSLRIICFRERDAVHQALQWHHVRVLLIHCMSRSVVWIDCCSLLSQCPLLNIYLFISLFIDHFCRFDAGRHPHTDRHFEEASYSNQLQVLFSTYLKQTSCLWQLSELICSLSLAGADLMMLSSSAVV